MKNEYIFYNGNIITLDTNKQQPEAVFVKDNIIYSIGSLNRMKNEASNPEMIDLKGKILIPAMTDAHTHFVATAMHQMTLDVSDCKTDDEFVRKLTEYRDNQEQLLKKLGINTPISWIQGYGWQKSLIDRFKNINSNLIDQVFPDIPVNLASKDLHANLVNTKVLKLISKDSDLAYYQHNPRFNDGFLGEHSWTLLNKYRPDLDVDVQKKLIQNQIHKCHKYGLCGVHSLEPLKYAKIIREVSLDKSFYFTWYYQDLNPKKEIDFDYKSFFLAESEYFRNGGIKIFSDGALGSDTAWMIENMYDGFSKDNKDYIMEIFKEMIAANSQKIQFAVHVIGDYAVYFIASSIKEENKLLKNKTKHRLEHCQAVYPGHFDLLKDANIHVSMQPVHMKTDIELINQKWEHAKEYSFPLNSISNRVELALGSDSPVETINPFEGIRWAINRDGFLEQEAISLEEALKAYTYKHHVIANKKINYGMIKKNQIANLIVIPKDAFDDPESYINEVDMTMIDGKIVFSS